MPSIKGNLLIQQHKICSQESRDENPESLSNLGLVWYQVVIDRWTEDRIMIASTCLAVGLCAVARKT